MVPEEVFQFLGVNLQLRLSYLLLEKGKSRRGLELLAEAANKGLDVLCISGDNPDQLKGRVKKLTKHDDKIEYVWIKEEKDATHNTTNGTSRAFTIVEEFLEKKRGVVYFEPFKMTKLESADSVYSFCARFVDAMASSNSMFLIFLSPSTKFEEFQEELEALVEGTINLNIKVPEIEQVKSVEVPEKKEIKKVEPAIVEKIKEEPPKKAKVPAKTDEPMETTIIIKKGILELLEKECLEGFKGKDWRIIKTAKQHSAKKAKATLIERVKALKKFITTGRKLEIIEESGFSENVEDLKLPITLKFRAYESDKDLIKPAIAIIFKKNTEQLERIVFK